MHYLFYIRKYCIHLDSNREFQMFLKQSLLPEEATVIGGKRDQNALEQNHF